jgi:hypothetical protein
MANGKCHTSRKPERGVLAAAARRLPGLIPRTPTAIFRALLGILLFFCGIVFGAWLIIRFRRHTQVGTAPKS